MKTALDIVGWISISVGIIFGIGATFDGGSAQYLALAIAAAASGLVFLALGAIVESLRQIERHLRVEKVADLAKTGSLRL